MKSIFRKLFYFYLYCSGVAVFVLALLFGWLVNENTHFFSDLGQEPIAGNVGAYMLNEAGGQRAAKFERMVLSMVSYIKFGSLDATTVKRICGDADDIQKMDAYERWEYDFKRSRGVTGVAHFHFQKGQLIDIGFNTK